MKTLIVAYAGDHDVFSTADAACCHSMPRVASFAAAFGSTDKPVTPNSHRRDKSFTSRVGRCELGMRHRSVCNLHMI